MDDDENADLGHQTRYFGSIDYSAFNTYFHDMIRNSQVQVQYATIFALSAYPVIGILWALASSAKSKPNHQKTVKRCSAFRCVNEVPVEIWRKIFLHAYVVDDDQVLLLCDEELHDMRACGCNSDIGFDWPLKRYARRSRIAGTSGENEYKAGHYRERLRYRLSYSEKLQFARISWMHWDVAAEFLYRELYVYDVPAVVSLARSVASTSAVTRKAIISFARRFRADLLEVPVDDVVCVADALACIMSCCPGLVSISISVRPDLGKERVWAQHWSKILQHIPQTVQCLELSSLVKRFENPALRTFGSLGAHYNAPGPDIDLPHLSFLRTDALLDKWQVGALTHLYIARLQFNPQSRPFFETEKRNMILLHLGCETVLGNDAMALLFKGLPNLRVFEYHYLVHGPFDVWTNFLRFIPRSLERIVVKTFVDACNPGSVLYNRALIDEHWLRFCNSLRPLFISFSSSPPNRVKSRRVPVIIILPRTAECETALRAPHVGLENVPLDFKLTNDTCYVRCGEEDESDGWKNLRHFLRPM